jgi:hypothetical protein
LQSQEEEESLFTLWSECISSTMSVWLNESPGPGEYSHKSELDAKGRGFSFGAKYFRRRPEVSPGPDTYAHQRSTIGKGSGAPAFSMAGKRKPTKLAHTEAMPGPGNYFATEHPDSFGGKNSNNRTASYSFGRKRQPLIRADDTPSANTYAVMDVYKKNLANTPSFSMTGKPWIVERNNDGPGPGAYNVIATKTDGPKYSFKGKYFHKREDNPTPGPNAYAITYRTTSGPKMSFGKKLHPTSSTYLNSSNAALALMRLDRDAARNIGEHYTGSTRIY